MEETKIMIIIPKNIFDKMIKHSLSEFPNEACGILAGKENMISEIYIMENIEKSPESFLMKPQEQLLVFKDIRKKKLICYPFIIAIHTLPQDHQKKT